MSGKSQKQAFETAMGSDRRFEPQAPILVPGLLRRSMNGQQAARQLVRLTDCLKTAVSAQRHEFRAETRAPRRAAAGEGWASSSL